MIIRVVLILQIVLLNILNANEAVIQDVLVQKTKPNTYNFSVTILHNDTGWKHYVNKWDILDSDNKLLGTRVLYHPHVDEQPFTRSKNNVFINNTHKNVFIRVHDTVHQYSSKKFLIKLP